MARRKPTRNPNFQESHGASVGYRVSTPGMVQKGYRRFQNKDAYFAADAVDSLSRALGMRHERKTKESVKEGLALAQRGGELTPGEEYTEEFQESYWKAKGSRQVSDYQSKALSVLAENPNMPVEEANQKLESLFGEMIGDRPDAYVEGFGPQAYSVKKRALTNHKLQQVERIRAEDLENKGVDFRNMLTRNMDVTEVRKVWSTLQKEGKTAGYNRNELNGVFLKQLTEFVKTQVENGHDEALALFDVKGVADGDNVILKDTGDMATKFRSAYNEAMAVKRVRDAEEEKERKKQQEQIAKDGTQMMNEVIRGETGVSQMQSFLDTNRETMNLRSVEVFEKFITDEQRGAYDFVDPQVDREVYTKMTNGSVEDDYTEDQIQSMYLNQQISKQTYNQAMRRYQTESSDDFTKLTNSGIFRGIMGEMVHLKAFTGEGDTLGTTDSSDIPTYYDMAEQALKATLAQEMEEQGSVTPERALELGRQVKEQFQSMAENTEHNPLKRLAQEYRTNGPSQKFYNQYKFYSGNPFMSKEEIQQELVDMGAVLDPKVQNATQSQAERAGGQQMDQPEETPTTTKGDEGSTISERLEPTKEIFSGLWGAMNDNPITRMADRMVQPQQEATTVETDEGPVEIDDEETAERLKPQPPPPNMAQVDWDNVVDPNIGRRNVARENTMFSDGTKEALKKVAESAKIPFDEDKEGFGNMVLKVLKYPGLLMPGGGLHDFKGLLMPGGALHDYKGILHDKNLLEKSLEVLNYPGLLMPGGALHDFNGILMEPEMREEVLNFLNYKGAMFDEKTMRNNNERRNRQSVH